MGTSLPALGTGLSRRLGLVFGGLVLVSLISGCQTTGRTSTFKVAEPMAAIDRPAVATIPIPTPKPTVKPSVERPRVATPHKAKPPLRSTPMPVAIVDGDRLMGLDAPSVIEALGTPSLHRRAPPAEVLQYQSDNCVVDVVLFVTAGAPRVVHVESRPRSGVTLATVVSTPASIDACLRSLRRSLPTASVTDL